MQTRDVKRPIRNAALLGGLWLALGSLAPSQSPLSLAAHLLDGTPAYARAFAAGPCAAPALNEYLPAALEKNGFAPLQGAGVQGDCDPRLYRQTPALTPRFKQEVEAVVLTWKLGIAKAGMCRNAGLKDAIRSVYGRMPYGFAERGECNIYHYGDGKDIAASDLAARVREQRQILDAAKLEWTAGGLRDKSNGLVVMSPVVGVPMGDKLYAAGIVGTNAGAIVGTNAGALVGLNGSGIVGTNSGAIVGTNAGAIVGTNAGALVGLNGSGFTATGSSNVLAVQDTGYKTLSAGVKVIARVAGNRVYLFPTTPGAPSTGGSGGGAGLSLKASQGPLSVANIKPYPIKGGEVLTITGTGLDNPDMVIQLMPKSGQPLSIYGLKRQIISRTPTSAQVKLFAGGANVPPGSYTLVIETYTPAGKQLNRVETPAFNVSP